MDKSVDECLRGAGCNRELCEGAVQLSASGHVDELLPQLAEHRLRLLSELRETDERLACLDRAIREIRSAKYLQTGTKDH